MLYELCLELKNFFEKGKRIGVFHIEDGTIQEEPFLKENQYFRIVGSVFNDGVYKYENDLELVDETFDGAIWAMAVPSEVIALADRIDEWQKKYGAVDGMNMSPYNAESFGGYSYSKSGGGAGDGSTGTWQKAFASELDLWRKIRI